MYERESFFSVLQWPSNLSYCRSECDSLNDSTHTPPVSDSDHLELKPLHKIEASGDLWFFSSGTGNVSLAPTALGSRGADGRPPPGARGGVFTETSARFMSVCRIFWLVGEVVPCCQQHAFWLEFIPRLVCMLMASSVFFSIVANFPFFVVFSLYILGPALLGTA